MPNKKKKYNSRFPPTRIKRIMQTDEDVGKVAAAVPVIISRALELFVESLIKNASQITRARNAKTLTTTHIKQCILAEKKFDFLKDLVASVPDVQAEDDSSNPPTTTCGSFETPVKHTGAQKFTKRRPRTKKICRTNAGPSQLEDDDDDEDDEEESDEEEDDEDDDEDETRSEDGLLPAAKGQLPHTNNQSISMTDTRISTTTSLNGATLVSNAAHVFGLIGSSSRSASKFDEDYDT